MDLAYIYADRDVTACRDEYIAIIKERASKGEGGSGMFSPYSDEKWGIFPTHKTRRKRAGLQTAKKDLRFSGTLLNSIKEIDRERTDNSVVVTLGFTGMAHRRRDQQPQHKGEPATNDQVARWLGEQEGKRSGNNKILKLSDQDRRYLELKHNVKIYDT